MTKSKKQEASIPVSELRLMASTFGNIQSLENTDHNKDAMLGSFSFSHQFGGIKIHINRSTEKQNLSISSELSPRLSFTILFEGEIDFSLGGTKHHIGHRYSDAVECSAYVLGRDEIFTRYLKEGMTIAKMNIAVEYDWLISRCNNQHQRQQIINLFQQHAVVNHWPACDRVIELANLLMNNQDTDIEQTLQNEYRAIELVSTCTKVLIDSLKDREPTINTISRDFLAEGRTNLKQMVNACLPVCDTLEDIADKLTLSVSTLQRKFKQDHGMTVIKYVRIQKLEMARSGLMFKNLSIGEASYLAGYNHASNFVTAFKKQFGITPSTLLIQLQERMPNSIPQERPAPARLMDSSLE